MICRNFIAPKRAFTQLSNEIIRHPRLSSDAVRLLTWQLSLPEGATESLSRTAERANIGATAFTRAKRQLVAEGFVHVRRVQVAAGRWVTQQLVSSVPLSEAEAYKVLGARPLPTPADGVRTVTERVTQPRASGASAEVTPQVAPSHVDPAVGEPTTRLTGGSSIPQDDVDNTSNHPGAEGQLSESEANSPDGKAPSAASVPSVTERARRLVAALPDLSPDLRYIPRGMTKELAGLAVCWLRVGHTEDDVRIHILRSLPVDGTRIHSPGGFLRYVLREVPPVRPRPAPAPAPKPGSDPAGRTETSGAPPRPYLSERLAAMRECEGEHAQARLFQPVGDEWLCRECLRASWEQREGAVAVQVTTGDVAGLPVDHGVTELGVATRVPDGRALNRPLSTPC